MCSFLELALNSGTIGGNWFFAEVFVDLDWLFPPVFGTMKRIQITRRVNPWKRIQFFFTSFLLLVVN